ncbi:MAG: sugar ABC transporter permease [Oscillospiraceae bacterium]
MESMIFKNKKPLFLFIFPAFALMGIFLYYPFVQNIINSFFSIKYLSTPFSEITVNQPFYENYAKIFTDVNMKAVMINTGLMILFTIVFQVGIALFLSLLVDNIKKGAEFFRTAYFFPIVISATALGVMFNLVFLYNGGMINQVLGNLGVTELIDWKDETHFLGTMFLPICWQYVGFYFVILVTGLNNISSDIYEAASIDGANGFKRVRYITLPLLYNTMCTCLTLAITGALKVFDLPWTMLPIGMPLDKSFMTGTYMYYQTFTQHDVDYGSTIALLIVVVGVVLSQLANVVFKEKDY